MNTRELEHFQHVLGLPHGIILVTGPTGSGKTSTLYTALNEINDAVRKIITVEDPVEYQLKGVNQIQVNEKSGLTFARGLRSILRHDPDVILIGEIRDAETAQIAVQASLTGHLVFSTLHTNDAPGALTRLVDMGVEPYLVASSLEAVLAQRLVRVLCPHCKQADNSATAQQFKAKLGIAAEKTIYKSIGCRECRNTGFFGRHAIFEWMDTDEEIRQLILKSASTDQIRAAARRGGMRTLAEDGWRLVAAGVTTVEEVLSVTTAKEVESATKNQTGESTPQALRWHADRVSDQTGRELPMQFGRDEGGRQTLIYAARAPALGFSTYLLEKKANHAGANPFTSSETNRLLTLQTDLYTLVLDANRGGAIRSLASPETRRARIGRHGDARGYNEIRGYFFHQGRFCYQRRPTRQD